MIMDSDSNKDLKFKIFRRLTIYLFVAAGFAILLYAGVHQTSRSEFCSSCHNMKPEFNTWALSSHSQIECVDCHIPPGTVNFLKQKMKGLHQVYLTITDTYSGPIIMPTPIPNSVCEKCHNMNKREVSPTGDLIIPHDTHNKKGINCTKCHSGIAHAKISERKATFKSDYQKWNSDVGKFIMSDRQYIRPDMETCMKCHELRNAPLECKACHKTEMVPENHKMNNFRDGEHGKLAEQNIKECSSCHEYMTKQPYEGLSEQPKYMQYVTKKDPPASVSASSYAKTNTFCKNCHGVRPSSHLDNLFISNHGLLAEKDKKRCMACHDNNSQGGLKVTQVACGSCHPSVHARPWKQNHPVPFPEGKVTVTDYCYTCHVQRTCASCHKAPNPQK